MNDKVPTRFVTTLLRMVGDCGHDFADLLAATGIDFDPRYPAAPGYRDEVSAMQYSRIYQQVLHLLQDETFGATGTERVTPGAFRMMCYCIISCANLGQAIQRAAEFYRTFFDERSQLLANFSDAVARVGYRTVIQPPHVPVAAAGACGLSVWHRFFGWLCGRPLALRRVDFSGDRPQRPERYESLFGCPVYYRQPHDLLYFDAECLAWPLVHTEHSLRDFLRTAPYQLLIMDSAPGGENLSAQVRAMLGHDFSAGCPGFDAVSAALQMSAPTLRRRLKREGTTFQALKDDARCDAAKLCLDRPELSINEVALQVGFTDPSAFHRSFKKWTGRTPGQYRAERQRDSSQRGRASRGVVSECPPLGYNSAPAAEATMSVQQQIEQQLADLLTPEHLEVGNESHMHSVPPDSETHFRVVVVSSAFAGQRKVARHQRVYAALAEQLAGPVHALALHTYTPAEWRQRQAQAPASPDCLGGSKSESTR